MDPLNNEPLNNEPANAASPGGPPSAFLTALSTRCPRCGKGYLFSGFLTVRERCAACGLSFQFAENGDGPAVFAILFLGTVMLGFTLWLELAYSPPLWVHAAVLAVLTPLLAVGLLRLLKAALIALQFRAGS